MQNIAKLLQNITIVADSNVLGEQDVLWGFDEGRIYDLVVTIKNLISYGILQYKKPYSKNQHHPKFSSCFPSDL